MMEHMYTKKIKIKVAFLNFFFIKIVVNPDKKCRQKKPVTVTYKLLY